ncbi:MAG: DNA polymerase II [Sandaracinaceae bacterium]
MRERILRRRPPLRVWVLSPLSTSERALYLLTRELRPRREGLELVLWGTGPGGPVEVCFPGQEAVFFVPRDVATEAGRRRSVPLEALHGGPVDAVYFRDRKSLAREAERLAARGTPGLEVDVKPADRFLMERFVTAGFRVVGEPEAREGHTRMIAPKLEAAFMTPTLRVASFDVESEGLDGPLISVAVVSGETERAFVRGRGVPGAACFETEAETLRAFLDCVAELDPDVLIGWNVVEFDVAYLEARCRLHRVPFRLGRGGNTARVLKGGRNAPAVARVPGRVVLDGIATMRAATWSFERWSLEHVAQTLLGRGKAIDHAGDDRLASILRMAREDMPALVAYNLEDCRLVQEIFERAHLLEFAIERQRLTGLTMDRRAGAVAAFDHLYLPRLHRAGRVAPTTGTRGEPTRSPGGYVMDSTPGLYDDVLVLDFKSLYPSLIRTFLVDPLGLAVASEASAEADSVEGFDGARFDRTVHILPTLIETLWSARDVAKKKGDAALSRAIKIQMNSFYGVLGTPACRFFDGRLASSITRRGHEVLTRSRTWLEERGHRVIYGDTDSLFVTLAEPVAADAVEPAGEALAAALNDHWRERVMEEHGLESALELEMETVYRRFLMPTMRHSKTGSKKRYAGTVRAGDGSSRLVVKGLEAVRTDWTPLARRFQRELLRRVFADEPYAAWARRLTDRMFAGELDAELVYEKRLRRDLDDYTKNVPPHVAAARQLGGQPRRVAYVITRRGPQPVQKRSAALNYDHYLERQLAPAAQSVLSTLGDDFMRIAGKQLSLF